MQSAKRSNAIVRSLFPAGIRDRLLEEGRKGRKKGLTMEANLPENYLPMETPKLRLKSYLSVDKPNSSSSGRHHQQQQNFLGTEPIADFFPATTILFADLAGFTAWSSTREPSQVFTLLETLYGAMDKTARRLGVFKVETVGDCYVAATGLPDPREDHAVLMVRFAARCLTTIVRLTKALETALGPGTSELAMRVGIHSGSVTAGVLRGEKSRFQLFGDTMNTAARIENTGEANRIHLSKETADLVVKAGKANWIESRGHVVTAKGKGKLLTYWLKRNASLSSSKKGSDTNDTESRVSSHALSDTTSSIDDDEFENKNDFEPDSENKDIMIEKLKITPSMKTGRSKKASKSAWEDNHSSHRLVDWNVEVLVTLLKKIIANRKVVGTNNDKDNNTSIHMKLPLDEVKEVIEMPGYNAEAAVLMTGEYNVEISLDVRAELKDYVHRISTNYRSNPFHNFEHASHVTLSANKLLKRIVMPDHIDYRRNSKEKEIEKVVAITKDLHKATLGISSDPVTQFAVVFSALIHDAGHTGVPNFILATESPDLADKYRNKSIAEQRSVDIAWAILMEDCYKNLRKCMFPTLRDMEHFRQLIVNCVLATDIFDKELSALRKARWQKCFHPEELSFPIEASKEEAFNRKATIVIEHIIQASDVAHTMQHWHVYQKWNERLCSEMWMAYREGRSDKDPLEGWYQGELWFFDNYVIPLAMKLKECGVFGVSSAEYLNYAKENRDEWERKGQEVVATLKTKFESSLKGREE